MGVLTEGPALSGEDKRILQQAIEQVRRIEVILKNFIKFARPQEQQLTRVNVNDVLDAAIALAKKHPLLLSRNSRSIEIVRNFDDRLPLTMADPFQLQQAFLDLLLNAAEAMPEGGAITVRTSCSAKPPQLSITILDTGRGIGVNVIDKIFLPFFTTKPKGTGLGLAVAKRLVEQHGGGIHAENNAAGGARFVVTLPLLKEDAGMGV